MASTAVAAGRAARKVARGRFDRGRCPICERRVLFVRMDEWLRDNYRCTGCRSIPRQRAVVSVLDREIPDWRARRIHEFAPSGPASDKLRAEAEHYTRSQFWPDVPLGGLRQGVRCEDLERLTFEDGSFDVVVTQDVFEHVLNPDRAFAEIARILRPDGAHVFTVPYYSWKPTLVRAVDRDGEIVHLEPPDYHGDPVDPEGVLVVTEWGPELVDFIHRHGGLTTTIHAARDVRQGLAGEFLEVFVSRR